MKGENVMPKFLAVHPVGKVLTLEAGEPITKAIKAGLNADAYWVSSVYAQEEGKLYCQWDTKDVESIQDVLKKTAPGFPTEGIYKIEMDLNSEDFR